MGLFSTVLHLFQKTQAEVVEALAAELRQDHGISTIAQKTGLDFQEIIDVKTSGVAYLVTPQHSNWTTVIEVTVQLPEPFYLYDLTNGMSKRLNTYALSFHLHDSDLLLYNLNRGGEALDGYNSYYQYFLEEPAEVEDILSQRHSPQFFKEVLPASKNVEALDGLLNEGYWNAFDEEALDEDGIFPEEYDVDEEERFENIGKYLEIFSDAEYPFANWQHHRDKLDLKNCLLLTGER